jgi:hypothetical protein
MFRDFLVPNNQPHASGTQSQNNNNTATTNSSTSSTSSTSNSGPLKAYLTPYMYCDQDAKRVIMDSNRDNPKGTNWEGYYWLPWRKYKGFPDSTGYIWGTMGSTSRSSSSSGSKKSSSSNSNLLLKICDT